MRLVVLSAAYPSPAEPGRAAYVENITRALARHLPGKEPIEARVVAPRVHPGDPSLEERDSLPVRRFWCPTGGRRLKEIARPSTLLLGAYLASALAATLEETRLAGADLLLCHWALPLGPAAAAASAILGVPLVVVAHGSDIHRYALSSFKARRLVRGVVRRARRCIAVSQDLKETLVGRLGADPGKVAVVPMGIDERHFRRDAGTGDWRAPARDRLGIPDRARILLFAGDLIVEKGVDDLLAAARMLSERGVSCELALAGEGPLRAKAAASGARLLGRLAPADLAEWYRAADLLVLPSHGEGTPVTVMEALTIGLPVIATRVGGIPALVDDGITGALVPPGDPSALAAAIEGTLRGGLVEMMRRRILETPRDDSSLRRAGELRAILEEVCHGA